MLQIGHLYKHKQLDSLVQVTEQQGSWVEFLVKNNSEIRYLEARIFEQAYMYFRDGDPITISLETARTLLRLQGILVPQEFSK